MNENIQERRMERDIQARGGWRTLNEMKKENEGKLDSFLKKYKQQGLGHGPYFIHEHWRLRS